MSEILHLNLHREFFAAIANKRKRVDYRRQSRYWRKRLEERKYDAILFRNGYAKHAPEKLVEFRGSAPLRKRPYRLLRHQSWTHIENQTVAEGASVMSPHATNRNALLLWTVRSQDERPVRTITNAVCIRVTDEDGTLSFVS